MALGCLLCPPCSYLHKQVGSANSLGHFDVKNGPNDPIHWDFGPELLKVFGFRILLYTLKLLRTQIAFIYVDYIC